jgi:hypothetical protein
LWAKAGERTEVYLRVYNGSTWLQAMFNLADGTVGSVGSSSTAHILPEGDGYLCLLASKEAMAAGPVSVYVYLASGGTMSFADTSYTGTGTEPYGEDDPGLYIADAQLYRFPNISATDGIYQADIESPTAWKTSGWITTAEYDFGWSNDEKLFGSIYIEHRALAEGQTITVEYSLDGGDTYLPAGFSAELGAVNKTITLNNVIGQTLKLRVTLAGPGTSTPKLTKLVARAIPMTDTKWIWDLRLLIRRNWGGSKAMEALERFVRLRRQLDFEDVDGKSYKVVIESVNFESDVDPKNESAHIVMRLREV